MNLTTCTIFFHNYYGRHDDWIQFFSEKVSTPFNLFYNIVEDSIYNPDDNETISKHFNSKISGPYLKKIILRKSSNQGKDIGGKLVLLDAWLRRPQENDYIIFLHDKTSPHKIQNQEWKKKLFQVVEPAFMEKALQTFKKNKEIGIIAGTGNISNELDHSGKTFTSNNHLQLTQLQSEFNVVINDYSYVAGTMFWARASPLMSFFRAHPPLDIRKTLEKGNSMDENKGSVTHAWERFLCWLIIAQGYKIKGLSC